MANITGTNNSETRTGTASRDIITMLGGNDIARARGGNDDVFGGDGDDDLLGEDGGDKLRGDSGFDDLFGGAGTDWALYDTDPGLDRDGDLDLEGVEVHLGHTVDLLGHAVHALDGYGQGDFLSSIENVIGSGFDDILEGNGSANRLEGRNGADVIAGVGGNDKLYGGNDNDQVDGGEGNDSIYGGSGDDELFGDSGNDTMRGEDGEDFMQGGLGNDVMRGGNQNDELRGGDGDDDLYGDAGNDIIDGQAGNDFLRGSASAATGQDIFVYDASLGDDQGDDIIFDFVDGTDTVLFDAEGLSDFSQLDSNLNNVLDNLDTWITVRNITIGGVTKQSTVIDVSKFEGDATTQETLTFYGNVGIEKTDFIIIPDEQPVLVVDNIPVDTTAPPEGGVTASDVVFGP